MTSIFNSKVTQLRLLGLLEGLSLLALVFIAVPVKYLYGNPELVRGIGPVHGILFILFVFSALSVGVEQRWSFKTTTWKVLAACVIPFGTFYIDWAILRKIDIGESK